MIAIAVEMDVPKIMGACRELKRNKGKNTLHTNILKHIVIKAIQNKDFAKLIELEIMFALSPFPSIESIDNYIRKMPEGLKNNLMCFGVYQLAKKSWKGK